MEGQGGCKGENFLPWLKAEFRWSERTARNYMSLAAHFQDKTANFADLDIVTTRELIDAPARVSEPIMRRAEAGETISQEEVKAAVRISRADCALPSGPPPRPAIKASWVYRNRGSPRRQPESRRRGA